MKGVSPKFFLLIIAVMLAVLMSAGIVIYMNVHFGQIKWRAAGLFFIVSFFSSAIIIFCIHFLILKKVDHLLNTVQSFRANGDAHTPSQHPIYSENNIDNLLSLIHI